MELYDPSYRSSPAHIDNAIDELSHLIYDLATKACSLKHPISPKSWWSADLFGKLQSLMKSAHCRHARHKSLSSKQEFLAARNNFTFALKKAKSNF